MPQTGTAWVPVYPDTRRVTPETARAFSRLGPYAVEITPQVKDMAAVRRAMASIPHVVVPLDVDDRELMDLRARLQALGNHTIGVDISAGQVREELASIGAQADRLSGRTARLDVAVDASAASAALQTADREVSRLDGRTASLRVVADIAQVVTAVGTVIALVNQLDGRTASINVVADTARAVMGLAAVAARATMLGGAVGGVAALGSVVLGLGPAGAIAAGGLGAAVLASGGVGKALTALGAAQDAAGSDAQASAQKQEAAAKQVAAAQDRVGQAVENVRRVRQSVADAAARANQQVERAEEGVALATEQARDRVAQAVARGNRAIAAAERQHQTAQRDLRRATSELSVAQFELTKAWEEGRRSLQDLQDQVDGNALDQRQAAIDLRDAEKELAAARASGDTDQIERAQLAYDRQVETIDQLNKQTQRLSADNAEAQARGIDGSDAAVAAQEREFAARERLSDAERAAGEASAAIDQARIDKAADVRRAREEGDRSIAAARQQLADAELAASTQERQGREQLADANRQVVEAQQALQEALASTASEASATQQALQTAFANLSPAAASFALYLWSLKGLFDQLRATAASGFFPPVQAGLAALVGQFSVIQVVIGQFASAVGGALGYILTTLANPWWSGFFSLLGSVAGPLLMQLAQSFMAVAGVVAQLIAALLPFAPMAIDMLTLVVMLIDAWTPFIALLVGQLLPVAGLVLQALMPLGPVLGALAPILAVLGEMFAMILGAALQALVPILVALTPLIQQLALAWGQQLVGAIVALTPLLVGIATFMSQHPQLVLGVISVLGGLWGAWQVLSAIVSAFLGPLMLVRLGMMAFGLSAASVLGPLGGAAAAVGGFIARIVGGLSFMNLARTALSLLGQAVSMLLRTVLGAIGPLGWIAIILGVLYTQNEAFRGAVNGLLGVLMQLVGTILASLAPVLDIVVQVMSVLGQVFAGVAGGLATALVPVIQVLADLLAWLTPVIVPLVQVFLGVRAAMMLWAAAQWALNIAMAANPIGLIVLAVAALVGAVVWAYQNLTWFRDIVDAVGQVFVWLWQTVLSPVVNFFSAVFGAVISWIASQWSWLSIVLLFITGPIGFLILAFTTFRDQTMAVFSAIADTASWFWNTILWPVISAIGTALGYLGAILFVILVAPFLIAWNLISAAVSWAWNAIILPVWSAIMWYINNALVPAMLFFYNVIIKPIWDAIGAAISFVWNYIILPVWTAIMWYINNALIPAVQFFYYNIIKPVWDAIGAAISFVWTNVIKPAFDAIWGGLQWLGDRFRDAVGNIQRIWDGIRGILARPINFMIDVVWNNGILKAWNMVAGLVGIPPAQPLQRIQEFAQGGTSENHRAQITSAGGPIRVWSEPETGGEAYIPMAQSKRERSTSILDDVAGRFGYGLVPRDLAMFGDGGLWRVLARAAPPGSRVSSSYRPGDSGYHGAGKAVDLVGNLPAINQQLAQAYPNSSELIYTPGINLKNGRPHTYNPAVRADHFDHVHWAMDNALQLAGNPGDGGGGGLFSFISTFFKDRARDVFNTVTNPVIDGIRGLMGNPPPAWREVVPALATKIRDTARDFVFKKADEKDAEASSDGGAAMGPPTAGQIAHAREIAIAAQERGIGHAGFVIALMTGLQESGLRILANPAVPASMGFPHEGVGRDHDSVGIFQQRQAGWGTLPMRMNARASAGMFLNKLGRGPYGDYGAEAQRVQVSAFPGKYSQWRNKAEEIARAVPYDDGGWAYGKGVMLKDVIQPERVLDPVESEAGYRPLVRLAGQLGAGQVQVTTREAATARAAAEAAKSDSSSTGDGPAVAVFYDTDGVLIGTMRGQVDRSLAELASAYRDGSS